MALTHQIIAFQKSFSRLAKKEIATRADLSALDRFPLDIWQKMAEAGALGTAIPREYGGRGGGYLAVVAAGESFVESGRNLGIALSWVIHQVAARFFILGFGNEGQRRRYLPELAKGLSTACIAISEPGVGAHPGRLKTAAIREGGFYTLRGEKTFLTNGPIAGLFIVFAITGESHGRKEYTAFLVPKDTAGLSLTEAMKFDFLRPAPHCGIKLNGCAVPADHVLGEIGSAYRQMAIPFRDLEDALLMGPVIGGMKAQLKTLVSALKTGSAELTDELKTELGGLEFLLHAMRVSAYEAARMIDTDMNQKGFLPLLLSLRYLARGFQSRLGRLAEGAALKEDREFASLTTDITKTINIASNVALIKQKKLGEALLSRKD